MHKYVRGARVAAVILGVLALLGTACSSSSSGGGDDPPANVSGTWRGLFTSDSYGGYLVLNIYQDGSRITGAYTVNYEDSGTLEGEVDGDSFDFELDLPSSCPGDISGSGTVNGNNMTLRFSGYDCEESYDNGYAEMTRD